MRIVNKLLTTSVLVLLCVFFLTASVPSVPAGSWQSWNPMGDVRSGAAAVLLRDGKVLISGGSNTAGPTASADLFDTNGVFTATTPMNSARSGHTATLLGDGRVLVAGGDTGSGITNSAEVYDPAAGSWTLLSATLLDARAGHTASLSDGGVLFAGGHNSGGALSTLEIFDPLNDDFTSAGTLTANRMNHAAAVLGDGRVLMIGGTADGTNALATVDIYDPVTRTVGVGPSLSTPRMSATATTTLDGKVAVIGGNNGSQDLASAESFDPATGQITLSASNLATPRSGHNAFLLPNNNSILIVGGTSGGADLNSAELYFPWTDSFQTTGAMSTARPGMAGSALGLDGRFLAAGGNNLASTELYGFATVKTDKPDYAPGEVVTITGSGWNPGETVMLTLSEAPPFDTHPAMTAIADPNGNIVNTSFSPDVNDLAIRFYLTAAGSGAQAQTTFTDASIATATVTIKKSTCSSNQTTFTAGDTVCASIAVTTSGGGGAPDLFIEWFNPSGMLVQTMQKSSAANNSTQTDTLALTGTNAVAGTWTVQSCKNAGCSGGNLVDTKTFIVNAAAANKLAFGTQPTTTQAGASIPSFTVQVQDQFGNLVTGSTASITVAIGTNPGGGTLSGTLTQNAVGGVATFTGLSINKTGAGYTLTASSGTVPNGATSSAFNITPGTAVKLALTTQPDGAATGGVAFPTQPVVTLQDVGGNTVTGTAQNVTLAIQNNAGPGGVLSGTKTVAVNTGTGQATFTGLSIDKVGTGYTLTATGSTVNTTPAVVVSNAFNISAGPAAKLAFTTSPNNSAAGVAFPTQPVVTLQDAGGNTVTSTAQNVTLAIQNNAGPGGVLSGATMVAVNPTTGQATFSGLSIDKAGTGYTLTATGSTVNTTPGVVVSNAFNITAGAAVKLAFTTSPNNITAGVAFPTQPVVTLQDVGGNTVTGTAQNVTLAIQNNAGPGGVLSGTKTVAVNTGTGQATFTGLSIDKAGTGYTLTATGSTVNTTPGVVVSNAFDITAAAATKLVVTGSGTQVAGTSQTLTITAEDNFGNTDTNFGPNVNLMFSGANSSPDPATAPTATNKNNAAVAFGSGTPVTFANGVTTSAMTLYKAETANIVVSDGPTITTPGALTVVVNTAAPNKLALSGSTTNLASGATRLLTATTQDAFGNTITSGADSTLSVGFVKTAGTGSVTAADSSTSANGVATLTVTGNQGGPVTITASATASTGALVAGTGNPITFTVVGPPTISKSFGTASIPVNGTTSLSFTITNPAANTVSLSGIAFSDTLPAGTIVATPNGLTGTCGGGTITAVAGSGAVSLSGATLAASASCTFSVNVNGTSTGLKSNTTAAVTSTSGGTGNTASASLTVTARTTATTISPLTASTPVGTGTNFIITVMDTDSGPPSNPVGSVAVTSTSGPTNTDSISACTLAQGANPAGTVRCQVTVTPTTPFAVHTINASYAATDSVHANSSTGTGAALTVFNPDTTAPVITINFTAVDGLNGWYRHSPVLGTVSANDTTTGNSNVTAISCTDGLTPLTVGSPSGIGTPTASGSLSVTGDGTHNISCTATDSAGNSGASTGSTAMPVVIKIDATAPSLTATRLTPANANGWNNTNVGVEFTCTDSTSLVASIDATGAAAGSSTASPLDVTVTSEGANQSVNGSCKDNAGNSATPAGIADISIDKTKPVITGGRTPAANAQGWNNTDVTVNFTCADSGSVQSGLNTNTVGGQTLTAEVMNASVTNTGSCVDKAGNSADSSTVSDVKIDKTAPNAPTAARTPAANLAGWNNTDVTVSFTSNGDTGAVQSGVEGCTTSSSLTAETNGTDVNGTCTDNAGNVSSAAMVSVKIDRTKPVITGNRNPAPNAFGWNNVNVTVGFSCGDSGSVQSGIAMDSVAGAAVTTEGMSLSVTNTGSCVDNAGNVADSGTVNNINIDKTAPSVSGTPGRAADHSGWYNHAVTVTWIGSDALSGIDTCDAVTDYSTPDSASASVSGHCKDRAGNEGSNNFTFKFDSTPPTAILAVTAGTLGSNGWYTSDVTVHTSGSDTVSNPTICTADQFQTAETTGAEFHGQCTNDAGLSANATPLTVKLDKTAPTGVILTASGTLGLNNWYTSDVIIQTSGTETISNPIVCTGVQSQTTDTAEQLFHGSCTNNAGLSANASDITVKRDATPPTVTPGTPPAGSPTCLTRR